MYQIKNFQTLFIFIVTLFILSYSLAFIYHFLGGKWNEYPAAIIVLLNSFIPLMVVLMLHKWVLNTPIRNSIGKIDLLNLWNLLVILGPIVYVLLTIVLLSLFPGVEINPNKPLFLEQFKIFLSPLVYDHIYIDAIKLGIPVFWLNLLIAIVWGLTINFIIGFSEEIAWRGFLSYLLKDYSFFRQSLVQGLIWAIWYAPFVWFAAVIDPFWAVMINTVFFLLLSPIYLYVRLASQSIFPVAILHGIVVSYSYFADVVVNDHEALWISSYIQVNFYLLILCNLLLFIYIYTMNPSFKIEFHEHPSQFKRNTISRKYYKKSKL